MSGLRAWALMLCACLPAGALAQDPLPIIREIVFDGNEVTQPKIMLREMVIKPGDAADPGLIERSRQGVQDLGLFRSVGVRQEPVDGGVRLVFTVKEKYYILPLPRADASSDGGYGYGVQLRWVNVWGLNHSFTPTFSRRKSSEGSADTEERGLQAHYRMNYQAPFVFDSPYGVGISYGRFETPYITPLIYDETLQTASMGVSRKLSDEPGSRGWFASVGLNWRDQSTRGAAAPPEDGQARSLSAFASYRDLHFNIYSDEGLSYSFGAESAGRDYGSDYHLTTWSANYARYIALGETPHQTVHFFANTASRHGGPPGGQQAFSLGGVGSIRGFEPETAQGDFYYLFSAEYLRPVFRRSIRALAVVDAGNAFPEPGDLNFDKVYLSAGLGVRVRIQAFVNLELELGMAWPLNGGSPRFFASKI